MKRLKNEPPTIKRFKLPYIFLGIIALYLCFICLKFPDLFERAKVLSSDGDVDESMDGLLLGNDDEEGELNKSGFSSLRVDSFHADNEGELNKSGLSTLRVDSSHRILEDNENHSSVFTPRQSRDEKTRQSRDEKNGGSRPIKLLKHQYGQITVMIFRQMNRIKDISSLDVTADEAWHLGLKEWEEVEKFDEKEIGMNTILEGKPESCPSWLAVTGKELAESDYLMFLPCGLAAGSSVTVIGTPHYAHQEYVPQLAKLELGDGMVLVSQFMVELQGLKAVDGEDPPKIFHVNPRLRGDWSDRPVIEHNTCYRMQWGLSQRCDGLPSKNDDDEHVDGYLRCEKWMRNDIVGSRESKIFSWFQRFTGRAKRPEVTWPFPFVEGRMFVLTVRAGVDGYHVNAGGRHVTSFPYRTGFTLEDATGLSVKGDLDVHSIYATSLPTSHPSFSSQRVLDFSKKWKSSPVPKNPVKLFIGVLSATNHFAERMAVRKTWMQSSSVKSSNVVVRFFVALNPRREVNAVLKKEAAYFGDIVILPFMDRYELVVLKTVAICLYGVQNVSAAYIMKCDDDNFVRVEMVLKEINRVSPKKSLYMGNLNLWHVPLRSGKWAVSYEEWPEEVYPPYANGPGYIISIDIAKFVVSQHQKHSLRLFKMEDVSMGMWIEQLNSSTPVEYSDNWRFCQFGCVGDYITAHYQSPRQMDCLWKNLAKGKTDCCDS